MKLDLTEEVKAAIVNHADQEPSKEVCGLLILDSSRLYALPCPNVSPQPEKSFLMPPSAYSAHYKNGTLAGYYHSHHDLPERPSEADIKISENIKLPSVIYSRLTKQFFTYEPVGKVHPLMGRHFELGVFDCVALVEDYFTEKCGFTFKPCQRTPLDILKGMPNFHTILKERDFVLASEPIKQHDIICLSLGVHSGECNHLAVYSGNKRMMHQMLYRPSEEVYYGGYWQKHTVAVYRHKTLL